MEPTEARFRATVIDPLVAGYVDAATNAEFKVAAGDQPSITAILLHMYLEARSQWDAWSAARGHRPSADDAQPAVAAGGPAAQVLRRLGPPVQAYNAKLLDGKPRQFPTRRLAGADAVLSRIYHEHTVSKAYTPLLLGEILSARTWTSADELNKLAAGGKEPSGGALHIVAGTVVAAWEPRGVMAMPDRRGSTDFGVRTRPMWRGKPPGPGIRSTPGRFSTSWWPRLAWAGSRALARPPTIGQCRPSPSRPWQTWGSFANRRRDCFAALSFAICQVDENGELKLRRGEDWRRSGHNATMGRLTSPPTTSWTPIASGRCATPGIVAPFSPRLRA